MQNLFISPDDEFAVKFSVAIDKEGTIFCDLERKSLISSLEAMGREITDFTLEDYTATFKKPSFGDTIEMYGNIFNMNEDSEVSFSPLMARYNKIVALIKSWDLKGKEEKPTEEDIRQLHPVIAGAIGIVIDLETGGVLS